MNTLTWLSVILKNYPSDFKIYQFERKHKTLKYSQTFEYSLKKENTEVPPIKNDADAETILLMAFQLKRKSWSNHTELFIYSDTVPWSYIAILSWVSVSCHLKYKLQTVVLRYSKARLEHLKI